MVILNLILTLLLQLDFPLAQIQMLESRPLYAEPSLLSEVQSKARPNEVLFIYNRQDGWAQTAQGWLALDGLSLEPAVVHFGAMVDSPVEITPLGNFSDAMLTPQDTIGVAAIFENQALVYTDSIIGWADLNRLEITDPPPDVVDFIEQMAYVQVENAEIRSVSKDGETIATLPFGQEVTLLFTTENKVFIRSRQVIGWSEIENFDISPSPITRGETNASPINFYFPTPQDDVIELLDFRETVLVLGRDEAGKWLYLRRQDGLVGWSPAEYIDLDLEIVTLPIIEGN